MSIFQDIWSNFTKKLLFFYNTWFFYHTMLHCTNPNYVALHNHVDENYYYLPSWNRNKKHVEFLTKVGRFSDKKHVEFLTQNRNLGQKKGEVGFQVQPLLGGTKGNIDRTYYTQKRGSVKRY